MRVLRALVKIGLITLAVAVVAGLTVMVVKGRSRGDIGLDEWPDVPPNPAD